MTNLSVSDAVEWVTAVFVRNGCGADNAQSVARALVAAEADGLKGHGLSRIPTYLQMVRSGKIDGTARPSSTRARPGVLAIDAANGRLTAAEALGHREYVMTKLYRSA